MDGPPPINEKEEPESPAPTPKLSLKQIAEGLLESDIGDYLLAFGVGLNAFKSARAKRKQEPPTVSFKDEKND